MSGGASTCQADLRKTAISGLTASKLLFNARVLEYGTLKKPFFLSGPKNAYFANSPNISTSPPHRCGESKEGESTTRF